MQTKARIMEKLDKLESFDLDWVECMINHLIARTQQPPGPPRMDDPPDPAPTTPEQRSSFGTPFEGSETCPVPLETNIETMCFNSLIKLADKFGISHNESEWPDDEWPDREDALRVAVAEAMKKETK